MSDRFVVTAIGGWTINPGAFGSGARSGTSYSVIDTVACCREVGRFYAGAGGRGHGDQDNMQQAYSLCAELNAQEAEYEAMHS